MSEEFLHYLWKYSLFDKDLILSSGEIVEILNAGLHNFDAGPDFFNAKIKIENTIWAGNVEIHINSSDWKKHNHHIDKSYDNIILHVVFNNDSEIKRANGEIIPTVEISGKFNIKLLEKYQGFMNNKLWIPCQNQIQDANKFVVSKWFERLLIERLEKKTDNIYKTLELYNNNWKQTFYQHLARNFGFNLNAEPFELLSKSLPENYLGKHKDKIFQIEALLFGQAGLLDKNFSDDYPSNLKKEYLFLKHKFSLEPIDKHLWRFMRLRPGNFPTLRIAQFANLYSKSDDLFSIVLETGNYKDIFKIFDATTSPYWESHYVFDKLSVKKKKILGENAANLLIINTVVPFLFAYGNYKNIQSFKDRALEFLEQIPGEKNSIINRYEKLGMTSNKAYHTQALLELKKNYCNLKKCLQCSIGNELLKNG